MSTRTAVEQFVDGLVVATTKVLSERPPAKWSVKLDDPKTPFAAGSQLMTLLLVAEPSKAEAAIQINLESMLILAGVLSGATAPVTQLKPEHAQIVRTALAKACEAAAQPLQVQVQLQPSKGIAWTPAQQFSMTAGDGATSKVQFQLVFMADWPKAAQNPAARSAAGKGVNVAMLEGVELEVAIRFGQRQLSLREIGELRSGSLVELDRLVQDPAELLLGDRVIARGEVVVVDGNYGLRVTEIV
jgi:flagellar motor switch protein FliN